MDLLVNKYAPKTIENVIGNVDTIETLNAITKSKTLPHLLFTGPPGTGKTTSAKIMSFQMLNKKDAILELNASDDRGIDTVRTTIKDFSMKTISDVPFKIIILDECDSMTVAAQQAMRRIMEIHSKECKFILICNDFSKIFEPIQSRCAILKFDKIEKDIVLKKLLEIARLENINITDDALDFIVETCDGDMRHSLNILQPCINNKFQITEDYMIKLVGIPSPKLIGELVAVLLEKNEKESLKLFDKIWNERYDPEDLITSFFRVAKSKENYELVKIVGLTHLKIVKGCNSKMTFYGMFFDILNL